ncbi:diguanylate cyclase [Novosphingobium soli]|uniref:diguanylate cyclase n=1 Tax=Novosphingobium soli TaxID=574956 RepID=A0ABV6CYH7_9SPHN
MRKACVRVSLLTAATGTLALASPASAMCNAGSAPIVAQLQEQVLGNPSKALQQIEQRLKQPGLGRIDRAWLHAAQAFAYSTLEMSAEEVRAAEAGLRLAPDPKEGPHVELLVQLGSGLSDPAEIAKIKQRLVAARRFVAPGSVTDVCSRAAVGYLSNEPAESLREMGTAYRMAMQQGMAAQRAGIALDLAGLLMKAGDYEQAQSLIDDSARWAEKNGQTFQSASIAFRTAMILTGRKDYAATIPQFERAYRLARSVGNDHFAAFAALSMCQSYISLNRFSEAQRACNNAERLFGDETIALPRLMAYRSRIALGLKDYETAIALSTELLDGPATVATRSSSPFQTRALAYAGLGRWQEAFTDLKAFLDGFRKETEASRTRETASLRTQVEIDRQLDRNKALSRELAFQQERARYERQQTLLIAFAAGALLLLLALFLVNGRRHRRALETLASTDALTGISNRRDAIARAAELLGRAADARMPVAVALVDVDHFKQINDVDGHAAGDAALKALAGVLKSQLRHSDVVGRWGGEEFVIVLPGLRPTEAADVVARIRTAAAELERPLRFSAGIAAAAPGERSLEAIVARADAALYAAKSGGRNRSVIAEDAGTSPDSPPPPAARRRSEAEPASL